MVRVALDAMGGDQAPKTEIEGAIKALQDLPPTFGVQLVGPAAVLEQELAACSQADRSRLSIVEAPEVIGMGERPLEAVRRKRKSSIRENRTKTRRFPGQC